MTRIIYGLVRTDYDICERLIGRFDGDDIAIAFFDEFLDDLKATKIKHDVLEGKTKEFKEKYGVMPSAFSLNGRKHQNLFVVKLDASEVGDGLITSLPWKVVKTLDLHAISGINGATVKPFVVEKQFYNQGCDLCENEIKTGETAYHVVTVDYLGDLCSKCKEAFEEEVKRIDSMAIRQKKGSMWKEEQLGNWWLGMINSLQVD